MTLYKFRLAPGSRLLQDAQVIDRLDDGWDFLAQAISLWHLVDPARGVAVAGDVAYVAADAGGLIVVRTIPLSQASPWFLPLLWR